MIAVSVTSGFWSGLLVGRGDDRASEGVEGEVEADDRRAGVRVDLERVDVDRVHHEEVAVRDVAGRRCGAAVRLGSEVVADVERAGGQVRAVAARTGRQLGGAR